MSTSMSMAERMALTADAVAYRPDLPEEGHPSPLVGTVIATETGSGDYGDFPIIYIKAEGGTVFKWFVYGGVAQGKVAEKRPEPGDSIGVQYLGARESKTRSTDKKKVYYNDWNVVVERAGGGSGIDYDAIGKAADEAREFEGADDNGDDAF